MRHSCDPLGTSPKMNDEHKKNDVRGMWGGLKGKETRIGSTGKNTAMATTKKEGKSGKEKHL